MVRKRAAVDTWAGHQLLQPKLELLAGASERRPNLALDLLTGRTPKPHLPPLASTGVPATPLANGVEAPPRRLEQRAAPLDHPVTCEHPRLGPRTVYLTDEQVRQLDRLLAIWQPWLCGRWSRSAVLRLALSRLRADAQAGFIPGPDDRGSSR